MEKLILYSYYRSSCSYRVRIALNLKGQEYEYRAVHLVKDGGEHRREDYSKLNPMSQVPALIHGDLKLAQSMAIIHYLDKLCPDPKLFPDQSEFGARVIQLCEMINSGIQPLQNLGVMQKLGEDFGADKEAKNKWSNYWIHNGLRSVEQFIAQTSDIYCFGSELTAADCFLIPQIYNARRFNVDLKEFPRICKVEEHCLELSAFKEAQPENQLDAPAG